MINLRLKADISWSGPPLVTKLLSGTRVDDDVSSFTLEEETGTVTVQHKKGSFSFMPPQKDDFDGDILLLDPEGNRLQRLFRANSRYNTLLVTERCDQLCVMCSQPPRKTNDAWRFPLYIKAICLAPENATICLSGGEPTLYKEELFNLLETVAGERPDIKFHILSNAQHFVQEDVARLRKIHEQIDVLWGIPLYASQGSLHEDIVDKEGSFNRLMKNLYLLGSAKASIELRTVVMGMNALELEKLAIFISQHLAFINYWALMAMEPAGYAKANLKRLFFDHSLAPQPIHKALDIAEARSIPVRLFNFPLCTVGKRYRKYCSQSISDWKRKYLDICSQCDQKSECSGFFEWYNQKSAWARIEPLNI